MVRTAIVYAHDNGTAIIEIGDSHVAGQRQRGMRGRDTVHVIDFAIGSQPAVEIAAVPGSYAFGPIARILGRHIGAAVDRVRPANAIGAAALGPRLPPFTDPGAAFLPCKRPPAM